MSISPEKRYCLGGLMKDIDKELSDGDLDTSNDGTTYKSSQDKIFSFIDTKFTPYLTFFSPSLENMIFFSKDDAGVKKARENLTGIFIALAVIWLAWIIISFIFRLYNDRRKGKQDQIAAWVITGYDITVP